jgi:hypothetical protein
MKPALILLVFLVAIASSDLNVVVREDFSGSTFPPVGWATVLKIVNGGTPFGGWSQQNNLAHGEVHSSSAYSLAYSVLFTPAFHLNSGDRVAIIFDGKPGTAYYTFVVLIREGHFVWSGMIEGPSTQMTCYQFKTDAVTTASDYYRVGWDVEGYMFTNTLDVDDIKVAVLSPGPDDNTITQVEASSLGRLKSLYK